MRAKVIKVSVTDPVGETVPAWHVVSENGQCTLFSGTDACPRATQYAQEHYDGLEFVMVAELGALGLTGNEI
jgi:hypothetical protein